jgi:hypothetical protein
VRRQVSQQNSVTRRVDEAVRAVLPRSATVRTGDHGSGVDYFVNGIGFAAKWAGEGALRQAQQILGLKPTFPMVVVGRRLSPGARDALSRAGVGWIDETGAAEIAFGSLVVSRSGHPERVPETRWTPAVLAVAEALLCGRKATVSAMQEATRLSSGGCTYALRILARFGLLTSKAARGRASAREVVDRNELLDAYATAALAMPLTPSIRVGVTWRDVTSGLSEIGARWDRTGIRWAATGVAAASVIAPYITAVTTADVYIDARTIPSMTAAAALVDLQPIEGGRLVLRPFPTFTTSALAEEKSGLRVAPWPRVYVDLRTAGVRGEEAAEHLRELQHRR